MHTDFEESVFPRTSHLSSHLSSSFEFERQLQLNHGAIVANLGASTRDIKSTQTFHQVIRHARNFSGHSVASIASHHSSNGSEGHARTRTHTPLQAPRHFRVDGNGHVRNPSQSSIASESRAMSLQHSQVEIEIFDTFNTGAANMGPMAEKQQVQVCVTCI